MAYIWHWNSITTIRQPRIAGFHDPLIVRALTGFSSIIDDRKVWHMAIVKHNGRFMETHFLKNSARSKFFYEAWNQAKKLMFSILNDQRSKLVWIIPMVYRIRKYTFKKNLPDQKILRSPFRRPQMLRFFSTWWPNLKIGLNNPQGVWNKKIHF